MDILLLDNNFNSVCIIDEYKSFIWNDRHNSYGDFELYLPAETRYLDLFTKGWYLECNNSDRTMIIEDVLVKTDLDDGNYITVTGRSLESILDRRIVWGLKVMNGKIDDKIEELLNENLIKPSDTKRKIDGFLYSKSTDDRIKNITIDIQNTGDSLYSVITSLCETHKLGFKVTRNDSNFIFSLYKGIDYSFEQSDRPWVVFSPEFDNMINSDYYTSEIDYKNVTLVGGEGEGTDRRLVSTGDAEGLLRRELFTDARDISSTVGETTLSETEYNKLLITRGEENLAECKKKTTFDAEVDSFGIFVYGEHFTIGDTVQFSNEYGYNGTAYISEFIISFDENGLSMFPRFEMNEQKGDNQ